MKWKINNLTIKNFKFFEGQFVYSPQCKNVLLYGENGSGKSSIYWALYTIFQSCLKSNIDEIKKYFIVSSNQNLRNRFCADTEVSSIEIEFKSEDGRTRSFKISSEEINTIDIEDTLLKFTVASSDFMNYKFLSSLFDFRNSVDNDVFPIFAKDIFPLIDFTKGCPIWDNTQTISHTADAWWNTIKEWPDHISEGGKFRESDAKYKEYQRLLGDFHEELNTILLKVEYYTNEKLKNIFNLPVEIKFDIEKPKFNCLRPGFARSKDGLLHNPRILIKACIKYNNLQVQHDLIEHPKTFFNEAKLSCIALAIRLSFFDLRLHDDSVDCAEVFSIDDLLLSLDMSNRMRVIDILLSYNKQCQMFVFTHDKSFFNLFFNSTEKDRSNWKRIELYTQRDHIDMLQKPCCFILNTKDYMDKAHAYFQNFDYAACANALRKKTEELLKKLLPQTWSHKTKEDGTVEFDDLAHMINHLPQFFSLYNLPNLTPRINQYRQYILNPLSHDNLDTPIYAGEVEHCMKEIGQLCELDLHPILTKEQVGHEIFSIHLENNGNSILIEFVFIEYFSIIIFKGAKYYENSKIQIVSSSHNLSSQNKSLNLTATYENALRLIGMNQPSEAPNLLNTITRKSDGRCLGVLI